MPALELAQELRDDDGRRAGRGADREQPRDVPDSLRDDLVEHLFLEREKPLCAAVEAHAGLGRLDAPARPVEELRAESLLERPHLEGHGRLGHAEVLRRLRERASLDDGAERGELARIHKRTLYKHHRAP